jgi:hypothetical protein
VLPPGVESRTRLQKFIRVHKIYTHATVSYGLVTSTGEPGGISKALNDVKWRSAMQEEYDALLKNKI